MQRTGLSHRLAKSNVNGQPAQQPGASLSVLASVILALCLVAVAACSSNPEATSEAAKRQENQDARKVYSCSDIRVDDIIERHLKRNARAYSRANAGPSLYPHFEYIARRVAKDSSDKKFSSVRCKIISDQLVELPSYIPIDPKESHYIIEVSMGKNKYISRICITRNEYSSETVITEEEKELRRKILREGPVLPVTPNTTKKCFNAGELL